MSTKKLLRIAALMLLVFISSARLFAGTVVVNSNITTNTTWTNNNTYIITGYIYVTNGATLTINAGTWIQGDSITKGSLIVTRGSKLHAVGSACQPIVFTSEKPAGLRKRGDWGGIILLGYAQVNWAGDTGHVEGITPIAETLYGGGKNPNCGGGDCPNNADNSGDIEYVRIEFAGVALAPNNEINGLTMGGVGNGTTIDHVMVSYSNDDSYEWFGGSVNCSHLVAYDGIDDDFDTDNGFSGKIQFGVSMRDPAVADVSGSKNYESDNDPTGSANTPQTSCIFQNMTTLGGATNTTDPNFKQNGHIRRNSACKIYNSIMMGMPQGILVDGASTIANCATSSFLKSDYVEQATANYRGYTPAGDPNQPAAEANLAGNNNVYSTQYSGVLTDPDFPASSANDFVPAAGNPLPSSDASLYSGGFWTSVSYVGAFNPAGDSWAGDWTNFSPVTTAYATKINYTPTVTTTSITDKICPNSGAIDITPSGGISPYAYSWSNGATSQDLSGISNGTYTVTVFDAGKGCSATSKKIKVANIKPILTSCSSTSTSITVNWSANLQGKVTNYQIRNKKHTVSSYGPWVTTGNVLSYTTTGLLSNTQYDFQLRGNCSSGNTSSSSTLTCSTSARFAGESLDENGIVISTYPNPTNGTFQLSLNGFVENSSVNIQVTNTLGQVVYEKNNVSADQMMIIDLSNSSNGLYQVIVMHGANRYSQNVVLNK